MRYAGKTGLVAVILAKINSLIQFCNIHPENPLRVRQVGLCLWDELVLKHSVSRRTFKKIWTPKLKRYINELIAADTLERAEIAKDREEHDQAVVDLGWQNSTYVRVKAVVDAEREGELDEMCNGRSLD